MQYFKSNLTKLKSRINELLIDEDDIYGFSGFSKKLFLDEIDIIYSLLREIENVKECSFEKIYLNRQLASVRDKLNNCFKNENPEYTFRDFVDEFAILVDKVKIAYSTAKNLGYILDKKHSDLHQKITELKVLHDDYQMEINEITGIKTEIDDSKRNIDDLSNQIIDIHSDAQIYSKEIISKKETFEELYNDVDGWDQEIRDNHTTITKLKNEAKSLHSNAESLQEKLELNEDKLSETLLKAKENENKHNTFLQSIEETLGNANRVGMAGSFKERNEKVTTTQYIWLSIFILSLVSLTVISMKFMDPFLIQENNILDPENLAKIISRLTIISPIIWLAWFSAKNYGISNKIREDYSFKYATAMAYEGYKKAAEEIDQDLAKQLLESSIHSISEHPIRLYSKKDHPTPLSETLDNITKSLSNVKGISLKFPGFNGKVKIKVDEESSTDEL